MARGKGGIREGGNAKVRTTRKSGRPVCMRSGKIRYRDGHDAALALRALVRKRSRADTDGGRHTIRVLRTLWRKKKRTTPVMMAASSSSCWTSSTVWRT